MKSRVKILSGLITLSLVFIAGTEAKARGTSKWIVLKKKGRVRALYSAEEDKSVVEAYNLTIREAIDKDLLESFRISVDFQIPGKRVTAPKMIRTTFDSYSRKRRFSGGRLLTIYSGDRKIDLTAIRDVWRSEREGEALEIMEFSIPYVEFKELNKNDAG